MSCKGADTPAVESMGRSIATICMFTSAMVPVVCAVNMTHHAMKLAVAIDSFTRGLPSSVPVVTCALYVLTVMWHLCIRSDDNKAQARAAAYKAFDSALVVWNYGLAMFSAMLLLAHVTGAVHLIRETGSPLALICDGTTFWMPSVYLLWQNMFMWSKFIELIDTMFLIVRGKEVLFLHWYHHTTVLLYCWMVTIVRYPGGIFAVMNAFVHTIMYYYYAKMAQGVRPSFGKALTTIQLIQMLVGCACAIAFVVLHWLVPAVKCNGSEDLMANGEVNLILVVAATGLMYGSYLALFAQFYARKYYGGMGAPKRKGN